MFDLTGKKALVTGGSRGIGRGIALALAKQGADVAVNYHANQKEAEEVVSAVRKMKRDSFSIQADVSSVDDVIRMFQEIKKKWGKLEILVNNAGVAYYSSFETMTEEEWDKTLNTNLKGQFLCAREAVKLMEEKGGKIINISSIASGGVGIGFPGAAHYAASKGGIIGMTESMAAEWAELGITVNAIGPGVIETPMTQPITEELAKEISTRIPLKRIGKPEEISAAVVFLASEEASYVTGATIYVDGGWLAQ